MVWDDSLIFPELGSTDKGKDFYHAGKSRGYFWIEMGGVLAGKALHLRLELYRENWKIEMKLFSKIAELLEIEPEVIEKETVCKVGKEDSLCTN